MDPFHVVRLAGDAVTSAHAGSSRRSMATAAEAATRPTGRRTLHTGADLLTDKQKDRLAALLATN
jgi:hypothetical protein